MPDQGLPYSKASLWIKHQLGDMNYHSAIMLAHEALADIADKIERNEITDDKRKPVADVIRYVSRLMIQRYDPVD